MNEEITNWAQELSAYRLPRWDSLPEIDLYMDQLISLLEKYLAPLAADDGGKLITPAMINNYVKLKIIAPPVKKKYSREHFASLVMVCVLKAVLPIPVIQNLIACQLQSKPIDAVYDNFCAEQQAHIQAVIREADGEQASLSHLSPDEALGALAMKMAMLSNAGKIFSEKAVSLKSDVTPRKK